MSPIGDLVRQDNYDVSPAALRPVTSAPVNNYPTSDDAAYAQNYGLGYGDPRADAYVTGQAGRVLPAPADLSRRNVDNLMNRLEVNSVNQSPAPPGMGDIFARASLATNRIPIAGLGFDPGRMTMDPMTTDHYIRGLYSPKNDLIYFNKPPGEPSTPVHESIHRGLRLLRQDPANAEAFRQMPSDEEQTVRYLMATQAGNPEVHAGYRQRADALRAFTAPEAQRGLTALTRAAEDAIARRRPGGPR